MHACDVVDFIRESPLDCAVVAFPPTYKMGYERLYRAVDATFSWDVPAYVTFDDARFEILAAEMQRRRRWLTLRDCEVPSLAAHHVGMVQSTLRAKPVWMYGNADLSAVVRAWRRLDDGRWSRA